MIAFSVTAQVQHFVLHMSTTTSVQMIDLVLEPLPLRFLLIIGIAVGIRVVDTVD